MRYAEWDVLSTGKKTFELSSMKWNHLAIASPIDGGMSSVSRVLCRDEQSSNHHVDDEHFRRKEFRKGQEFRGRKLSESIQSNGGRLLYFDSWNSTRLVHTPVATSTFFFIAEIKSQGKGEHSSSSTRALL